VFRIVHAPRPTSLLRGRAAEQRAEQLGVLRIQARRRVGLRGGRALGLLPVGRRHRRRRLLRRGGCGRCSGLGELLRRRRLLGGVAVLLLSEPRRVRRVRVRRLRVLLRGRGPRLQATAIAFNSDNDLAVLRVGGLSARALPLARDPRAGTSAAVLGFPHNGPFDVRAARLGETRTAVTQDAYGRGPVQRRLVSLRGVVRSGNSGGPIVDGRGRVVGTVFAATTSGPRGGYAVPNAVVRRVLAGAREPVSTGPCAR